MGQLWTEEPITIRLEHPAPGTVLLAIGGEVDMLSSPSLRESIASALAGDHSLMIIDLDKVEFLGTSGLAALVEARAIAADRAIELWLACSRRQVLRPLRIAGLFELFRVADSAADVLAAPSATPAGPTAERESEIAQ
ncbi:MAG TPA: STAS domain-containing protein [Pseudonocardia sp.]|nr:STAS domain-containing protein [Pseudonocardia sp.]